MPTRLPNILCLQHRGRELQFFQCFLTEHCWNDSIGSHALDIICKWFLCRSRETAFVSDIHCRHLRCGYARVALTYNRWIRQSLSITHSQLLTHTRFTVPILFHSRSSLFIFLSSMPVPTDMDDAVYFAVWRPYPFRANMEEPTGSDRKIFAMWFACVLGAHEPFYAFFHKPSVRLVLHSPSPLNLRWHNMSTCPRSRVVLMILYAEP